MIKPKHKRLFLGFTLIELMITISIIVLMAMISVPTFSTFQKKAQFAQNIDSLSEKIGQYELLAKNPELGGNVYRLTQDSAGINFYKDLVLEKTISPSDFGNGTTIEGGTIQQIQCYAKTGDCCFNETTPEARTFCKDGLYPLWGDFYYKSQKFLTIKNYGVKKQAIINVTDKPFSVNIEMSDL